MCACHDEPDDRKRYRRSESNRTRDWLAAPERGLGEIVADVAEDVGDLIAKEHERNDHCDRDDRDDQRILNKTLARVVVHERDHPTPLPTTTTAARQPTVRSFDCGPLRRQSLKTGTSIDAP